MTKRIAPPGSKPSPCNAMDLAAINNYAADLATMNSEDMDRDIDETLEKIDELESWLEALAAKKKQLRRAAYDRLAYLEKPPSAVDDGGRADADFFLVDKI